MSFATQALKTFDPLLLEMIRARAPRRDLEAEGFTPREIDAASQLLLQSDPNAPLDAAPAGTIGGHSATTRSQGRAAGGETVTLDGT